MVQEFRYPNKGLISSLGESKVKVYSSGQSQGTANDFIKANTSCWTTNSPFSWFLVDIGDKARFVPVYYSLAYASKGSACVPKNWVLQGAVDLVDFQYKNVDPRTEKEWTTIIEHIGETSIQTEFIPVHFSVKTSTAFRYFRIVQIGVNSMKDSSTWKDVFVAGNFEMWGSLYTLEELGEAPIISKLSPKSMVVTSSSIAQGEVGFFILPDKKSVWTKNEPNSWFCVDFVDKYIEPARYKLRYSSSGNNCCPRNWLFQGSNDQIAWTTLSTHKNDTSIHSEYQEVIFPLQVKRKRFRCFRVIQTGPNAYNGTDTAWHHVFVVGGFEIFGSIHKELRNEIPKFQEIPRKVSESPRSSPSIERSDYKAKERITERPIEKIITPTPKVDSPKLHSDLFEGEWKDFDEQTNMIKEILSGISEFSISSLEPINTPGFQRLFHGEIEKVEKREKLPEFQHSLHTEKNSQERLKVLQKLNDLSKSTKHNRNVRIVRCWHGTDASMISKIADTGFAAIAKMDSGWFGKGIYFSTSPEYAIRYARDKPDPVIFLCYVIMANPFPFIHDDAPSKSQLRFYGMGNHKNYLSHYVPVIPYGDPVTTIDYRPPPLGQSGKYDELVIFNENHILPTHVIKLRPSSSQTPQKPVSKPNLDSMSMDQVCEWLKSLSLTQDYSSIFRSQGIDGSVLVTMKKEDFKEIGITTFGDLRKLENALNYK